MQAEIYPVLSSSVHGPLGIKHLPRLWLKVLLDGCGYLPAGYRCGVGVFDEFLTDTLGLDRDAFVAFIKPEKPDYITLEAWVRQHATTLSEETVRVINERVTSADLPEALLPARYARIKFDDPTYTKAVALNDLDDWAGMHAAVVSK